MEGQVTPYDYIGLGAAFLSVLLLILLLDMLSEAARPTPPPWRFGDPPRKPRQEATWGTHVVLGFPAIMLALFVAKLILKFLNG